METHKKKSHVKKKVDLVLDCHVKTLLRNINKVFEQENIIVHTLNQVIDCPL